MMGRAFVGYDCNSKMLCVAAYLLANDACSVEVSDDDSWVEFTNGSPTEKLHRTSSGANFQYVKYSGGTTGTPIGYESCWDMSTRAAFTSNTKIQIKFNRKCNTEPSDTISTGKEERLSLISMGQSISEKKKEQVNKWQRFDG